MTKQLTLAALLLSISCGGAQKSAAPAPAPEPAPAAPAASAPEPVAAAPAARPPAEAPLPDLAFPEDDFRKAQPGAGPARPVQLPKVQQFKLPSGVQVFLVEDHKLPTVTASLAFEGGSINDPVGKEGLTNVCSQTMGDSTETFDKVQLAETLADIASSVNVNASSDQTFVGMATLSKSLEPTSNLWVEVLLKPGMRQADFDRNVRQAKAGLRQQKGSPTGIGGLLVGSVMYGEDHPLGRFVSEASLSAITLDDCKAWSKDWFKPQGAKLWLAGDVTPAQVKTLTARLFKDWKGKPKASVKVGKPTPRKGKIFFVDVPGAAQSQIFVVHPGPERKAKDFFANSVVSGALGGGFTSRINMNIREDKGYAYGAYGTFNYTRYFGTFLASASVRTDVTDKSVIEVYKEIEKMATGDLSDSELTREKSGLILSLPARFETSGTVLRSFRDLDYYGLPFDYYAKFVKNVEAVDKKAAAKAAKDHLKPKDVIVFVVGDASVVLPGLQKLHTDKTVGEGDLVILDADGKVVGNR